MTAAKKFRNGAMFDPEDRVLIISARIVDVSVVAGRGGKTVTIAVMNLDDGIEIIYDEMQKLWRGV